MKKYLLNFLFLCSLTFSSFLYCQETDIPATPTAAPFEKNASLQYPLIYPETGNPAEVLQETDGFQGKFMNMLLILGLLIGFMILASQMLKRMMHSRVSQINNASFVKILETRTLSPRTTLYLLDIQGKGLLIAESQTGVNTLTEVTLNETTHDLDIDRISTKS